MAGEQLEEQRNAQWRSCSGVGIVPGGRRGVVQRVCGAMVEGAGSAAVCEYRQCAVALSQSMVWGGTEAVVREK